MSFFNRKPKYEIEVIEIKEDMFSVGFMITSDEKSIMNDGADIQKKFYEKKAHIQNGCDPWGITVITYPKDKSGKFKYFIGNKVENSEGNDEFNTVTIPKGLYAIITVKYKNSVMWNVDVANARRFFCDKWLPKSEYKASNEFIDMEYYDRRCKNYSPTIDLYFPIIKK
ncbi:MAG: GyrI-like domain-containing protein [Clostridium cadaveris]|uniref:GyrI-like domain-containing protein n=1 Tax=Clostridium cadaveris TaxID=1529 RepID=UPI002A84A184|nr:GyrI-like domain-containing protein [Clostridium cadaveris]